MNYGILNEAEKLMRKVIIVTIIIVSQKMNKSSYMKIKKHHKSLSVVKVTGWCLHRKDNRKATEKINVDKLFKEQLGKTAPCNMKE